MSSNGSEEESAGADRFEDKEPVALAYDDTDDELIAHLYNREVAAECADSWWIRVEMLDDEEDVSSDEEPEIDCPFCEDGEMYRDGSQVVCNSCGEVKLA